MAFIEVKNVRLAGISACVPSLVCENREKADILVDFSKEKSQGTSVDDFIKMTGVERRRIDPSLTTSDLGLHAAEKLIADIGWEKESISALLFVSQTADYILPATACILQDKLGLSRDCYAADVSLGCSGWVYGLSMAASLISNGHGSSMGRALLIAGDSKGRVPDDSLLFGAACTVTALEFAEGAKGFQFDFGSDGSGYDAIIIPDGGCRNGITPDSFKNYEFGGHTYNRLQTRMVGIDVFTFGVTTVPKSVKNLSEHFGFDYREADYYVFHQANLMMNEKIAKKLKLDGERVPMCIRDFGNTSSASIPLTIVSQLKGKIENKNTRFVCCGFGVGLSWGTVAFETDGCVISDLVELGDATCAKEQISEYYKKLQDEGL